MRTIHSSSALVLGCISFLHLAVSMGNAQETGSNENTPSLARISLFPVGDYPFQGMRIVNGKVVLIDPKPSEMPPSPVFLNFKRKDGDKPTQPDNNPGKGDTGEQPTWLTLNAPTQPFYRKGAKPLKVYTRNPEGQLKVYANITLPPPPKDRKIIQDLTVFLLRSREPDGWTTTPSSRIVTNDIISFPPGACRIVNLSFATILIRIDQKATYEVKPYDVRVLPISQKADINDISFSYKIIARFNKSGTFGYNQRYAAGDIMISDSGTQYPATERINFVFYNHDGYTEPEDTSKIHPIGFTARCELPAANKPPVRPEETPPATAAP